MITTHTVYGAKCDGCGEELTKEVVGFTDRSATMHIMEESGWLIHGEKHYCPDCWTVNDEGIHEICV